MDKESLFSNLDEKEDDKPYVKALRNSIKINQYSITKWAQLFGLKTKKELRWVNRHKTSLLCSTLKNPNKEKVYVQVSHRRIKRFNKRGREMIPAQNIVEPFDERYFDAILLAFVNEYRHDFRTLTCLSIINKHLYYTMNNNNRFWERYYGFENIMNAVSKLTKSPELPDKFNGIYCMKFLRGLRCPVLGENRRSFFVIETMSLSITLGLIFIQELLQRDAIERFRGESILRIIHNDLRHKFGNVSKVTDTQAVLQVGDVLIKKTKNGINIADVYLRNDIPLMDISQITMVCNHIIECILFNPNISWNDIVLSFDHQLEGRVTTFRHYASMALTSMSQNNRMIKLF